MVKRQRNKKIIVVSIILGAVLIIGAFWLGRISTNNNSSGSKNNLPPQRLEKLDDTKIKEEKVKYCGKAGDSEFVFNFNTISHKNKREFKAFFINKNHPKIKELLKKGKLQQLDEEFNIRYKKADGEELSKRVLNFNEFNKDLEIKEV